MSDDSDDWFLRRGSGDIDRLTQQRPSSLGDVFRGNQRRPNSLGVVIGKSKQFTPDTQIEDYGGGYSKVGIPFFWLELTKSNGTVQKIPLRMEKKPSENSITLQCSALGGAARFSCRCPDVRATVIVEQSKVPVPFLGITIEQITGCDPSADLINQSALDSSFATGIAVLQPAAYVSDPDGTLQIDFSKLCFSVARSHLPQSLKLNTRQSLT
eukprot:c11087_g1_i1.p1 GENE.c11087_g1_i1~~c11087_g1_i1.p1  ORF type:complete len:236 (-),score=18.96 c11087_g1_i1:158-793(-)